MSRDEDMILWDVMVIFFVCTLLFKGLKSDFFFLMLKSLMLTMESCEICRKLAQREITHYN